MSVWEALVFSISLITSNLLILNGIAKFDLKGKTPFTFLLMAFATSTGYGLLRYVTIILYDDFYLVTNILFFLNNLWLLVFFRNAVVQYNDRIPIGRYFVLSIVCFLLPISIGLFFNPINNFETLMVQMSYMLGIIPMVVYSSMLAGVSVGSAFWGIIIACFLFSVDFFLRFGFFHILQTEFQEVISETFRVVSILLISIFGHYGQPIPPGKIREVIPGTQRLNNIFFALIAFFPVMIFYTVFWQVNLNDRKMQQKEIELSKEVFMISSRMLEEKIDTYSRIVNEVKNSANLATAQWKLKTFLFTDPEIDVAQLLTSYPIMYKDEEVIFEKGRVTFYTRTEQGWGIKLSVNMEVMYAQFPVNESQRFYAFLNDTTFLYPPGQLVEANALFSSIGKRDFVFVNTINLYKKPFSTYLIFTTSPITVNIYTLAFMLGAIFILVLVWWFYGFYVHRWEKTAKEKYFSLNQAKEEYGEQIGRLESSLKLISGDLQITADKLDQFSRTVYQLTDSFSGFDFQKGPSFELKQLYDKLLSIMSWVEEILFFQKSEPKGKLLAFSGGEPILTTLPPSLFQTPKELWVGQLSLGLPEDARDTVSEGLTPRLKKALTSKAVSIDKRDLILLVLLKSRSYDPSDYEFHFLRTLFNISELYLKIFYSTKRNETISQKYILLCRFQMTLCSPQALESSSLGNLTGGREGTQKIASAFISFLRKIYPEASLWGLRIGPEERPEEQTVYYALKSSRSDPNAGAPFTIEKRRLNEVVKEPFSSSLSPSKPFMGEIAEKEGIAPGSHSRIYLPLYARSESVVALLMEFSFFKVFSNVEKEYLFFLCQILGEAFDAVHQIGRAPG